VRPSTGQSVDGPVSRGDAPRLVLRIVGYNLELATIAESQEKGSGDSLLGEPHDWLPLRRTASCANCSTEPRLLVLLALSVNTSRLDMAGRTSTGQRVSPSRRVVGPKGHRLLRDEANRARSFAHWFHAEPRIRLAFTKPFPLPDAPNGIGLSCGRNAAGGKAGGSDRKRLAARQRNSSYCDAVTQALLGTGAHVG